VDHRPASCLIHDQHSLLTPASYLGRLRWVGFRSSNVGEANESSEADLAAWNPDLRIGINGPTFGEIASIYKSFYILLP
jgi:hypothetical protein